MHAGTGTWVVKTIRPHGDWQLAAMVASADLERAALAAGLELARPVEPPAGARTVGYWAAVGDGYARVHEHLDGVHPRIPLDPETGRWLGGVVARLAALALPGAVGDDASRPLYSADAWRTWLDEADHAGLTSAAAVRAALPAIADAVALIRQAAGSAPPAVLLHRDLAARNLLLTAAGPRLVDWDYAGPEVPWWEAVKLGVDLDAVPAVLDGYARAGGEFGPADETAFAGLLWSQVAYAAYCLWVALGHRGGDARRRADADADLGRFATAFPSTMDGLGRRVALLR